MSNMLKGLVDRIFAVSGALIFAQLPMFMLQYTQQLAGRSAELGLQLNAIQRIAALNGKTMPEYIQKFTATNDTDFLRQGELMQNMMQRFSYLSNADIALSNASPLAKPFVFAQNFDMEIAKTTFAHFQFGVPFSIEGLGYALAGIGFGCLLFYTLNRSLAFIYRMLQKGRPIKITND